jgi:ribonuclease HII
MESLAALDDSKRLTAKAREELFPLIKRYALAYHVVFIPVGEVDRRGVHAANIEGMRRAVAGLPVRPGYVLSDGFRVPGLVELDEVHPGYGFADHKGYSTAAHGAALVRNGPCSQHRQSFINVRRVARAGRTELVAGFAVGQDENTSFDTTGTEGQLSR